MATVNLLEGRLDVRYRPGEAKTLHARWPADLTGRSFTATLAGEALPVSVSGAVMSIAATAEQLAEDTDATAWELRETTGGADALKWSGSWVPSTRGTDDHDTVTVRIDEGDVTVSVAGEVGPPGPPGPGVPAGGTSGQVLAKASDTDRDTEWVDPEAAGDTDDQTAAEVGFDATGLVHTDAADVQEALSDHDAAIAAGDARVGALEDLDPVLEGDARLSDARTPTSHAASHADGGSDELTLTTSQVTGLDAALAAKALASDLDAEETAREAADALLVPLTQKGAASGVATLDGSGVVPDGQLPAGLTRDTELSAAIDAAINALLDGAPGALNTLNELAAAVNDDASFAASITTALAGKQGLSTELTALAALTTTTFGRSLLELASSSAGRTALGVVIGADVQAWSSVLDATTAAFTTALKTKLDAVETGATADQTGAEILARLLAVDGAGSGLDADLLDGHDTGYFATATALAAEVTARTDAIAGLAGTFVGLHSAINLQTGTAYTLVLADDGKLVAMSNAASNVLTIPPNSAVAFPTGTRVDVAQAAAGATTIAAGSGVTIKKPATLSLVLQEQESMVTLFKISSDTWRIAGDLTAV